MLVAIWALLITLLLSVVVRRISFRHSKKIDTDFRQGVIPVLQASRAFSQAITTYFLDQAASAAALTPLRMALIQALQAHHGLYPEWVFNAGFNPGLRAGLRFFLIHLERMTELVFSMDFLVTHPVETMLLQDIHARVTQAMENNALLLTCLITYFEQSQIIDINANLTEDIIELERALQRMVPDNMELLDVSPDRVTLTAYVRDVKDMRGVLLRLVKALPT